MQFLLETIAYDAEIVFAAYNQIFQELLNPNRLIRANDNGANIVLIRFEDWLHYQKSGCRVFWWRKRMKSSLCRLLYFTGAKIIRWPTFTSREVMGNEANHEIRITSEAWCSACAAVQHE